MAINELYNNHQILQQARQEYNKQTPRHVQLPQFFQPAVFTLLQQKLKTQKYQQKFHPYKYRYSTTTLKEITAFVNGDYFKTLIKEIIGVTKYTTNYEITKFSAGDYTLLHDTKKEQSGVDFIIDFSSEPQSLGGHTIYLTDKEELLRTNPFPNSVTFVERRNGMMKYVKYVTHKQKEPVIFVVGTIYI